MGREIQLLAEAHSMWTTSFMISLAAGLYGKLILHTHYPRSIEIPQGTRDAFHSAWTTEDR